MIHNAIPCNLIWEDLLDYSKEDLGRMTSIQYQLHEVRPFLSISDQMSTGALETQTTKLAAWLCTLSGPSVLGVLIRAHPVQRNA